MNIQYLVRCVYAFCAFDCSIPSQRSPKIKKKTTTSSTNKELVWAWLEAQGSLALTNPGDDFCVLPYRLCLDTHAHFIMERELCMGKPWAANVLQESLNPSPREEPANESEANERLEEEVDEAMDEIQHLHHPWNEHDSDARSRRKNTKGRLCERGNSIATKTACVACKRPNARRTLLSALSSL